MQESLISDQNWCVLAKIVVFYCLYHSIPRSDLLHFIHRSHSYNMEKKTAFRSLPVAENYQFAVHMKHVLPTKLQRNLAWPLFFTGFVSSPFRRSRRWPFLQHCNTLANQGETFTVNSGRCQSVSWRLTSSENSFAG